MLRLDVMAITIITWASLPLEEACVELVKGKNTWKACAVKMAETVGLSGWFLYAELAKAAYDLDLIYNLRRIRSCSTPKELMII